MESRREMRALPWLGIGYLVFTLLVVYWGIPTAIRGGWFVPNPSRSTAWYQLEALKYFITWGIPFLASMWIAVKRSRMPSPRRSVRRTSRRD